MADSTPQGDRKPIGQPLRWTKQQIEAMALISDSDLQEADELWQRNAPPAFRTLLRARKHRKQ